MGLSPSLRQYVRFGSLAIVLSKLYLVIEQ